MFEKQAYMEGGKKTLILYTYFEPWPNQEGKGVLKLVR